MACLFAARLATAGTRVRMLGTWPEGLAALAKLGVTLSNEDGSLHSFPVKASANPSDFSGVRFAFVLVKSWQTERAADQLFASLAVDGVALTLQNGLGNREILVNKLGAERVAYGITTGGATLLGPAQVRSGGNGKISVAEHPRMAPLIEILRRAEFEIETTENIESLAWAKLVINASINPLTALLGIPNGELRRSTAHQLVESLANEVADVARSKRISLPFTEPIRAVDEVIAATANNVSSMLQDVRRGARTEIDAINGAVVNAGRENKIPTPVNQVIWQMVTALSEDQ
jgi:2-dehydropantoate 2-reductase